MTTLQEIVEVLERTFPLQWQESWDNSGLLFGEPSQAVQRVVVSVDITEAVVEDAIRDNAQLIIAHHPLIFRPIKQFSPHMAEHRALLKAIRHNVALYCAHTNVDVAPGGLNTYVGRKMGLKNIRVLVPQKEMAKIITYIPADEALARRMEDAVFAAGGGAVPGMGYDEVTFRSRGTGSFREKMTATREYGPEFRLAFTVDAAREKAVTAAIRAVHPYAEPVIDRWQIHAGHSGKGLGIIGKLPQPMKFQDFLRFVQSFFDTPSLQWTPPPRPTITTVAFVGGSGAPFLRHAIGKADAFITADMKYHQFFEALDHLGCISINHYDSEKRVMDLFLDVVHANFPNIAARKTDANTNPVSYF